MRMKVWGEISGERHLVGTLETIPGREERFSYYESYLESEAAQSLSVLLPLQEEPFPVHQTRACCGIWKMSWVHHFRSCAISKRSPVGRSIGWAQRTRS